MKLSEKLANVIFDWVRYKKNEWGCKKADKRVNKEISTPHTHLIPADGTGIFPFEPFIDALGMEDMVAKEFLKGFFLHKFHQTNRASD